MFVLTVLFSVVICVSFGEYNTHELDGIIEKKFEERDRVYVKREQLLEERVKALEAALKVKDCNTGNNTKRYVNTVPLSTPIGFTACVSPPNMKNLGAHHTITFDRVITNLGSGYHHNLGVFEAPLKGLYVFHVTVMTSPGQEQYISFMRNGVEVSGMYPDGRGANGYQTAAGTWVLELDQNSEVYVQTTTTGEIHGYCYTTFSGFLLQELE